jgi:hypothetical protein
MANDHDLTVREHTSFSEVFTVFLRLGLTSFGGPIAHLGYFRNEFVARRKWLDDKVLNVVGPVTARSARKRINPNRCYLSGCNQHT